MLESLPFLAEPAADLQILHLTGPNDFEKVRAAYLAANRKAVVLPFLTEIELALGAATLAISRAGASSLAELAALRLPAILIPYPFAAEDHQTANARIFGNAGAGVLVKESDATPEVLSEKIAALIGSPERLAEMSRQSRRLAPDNAAGRVADVLLSACKPNP